jgi:predicted transposase YbfD/YdcC
MAEEAAQRSLIDHFSALTDPRQAGKVLYPLPEIMLLILCATLAAADNFVEIRRWGREKLAFLRTMLPFARGIPSHDTLNDVMNALDPALFAACFEAWVAGLREAEPDIVAVDGKSSRRARRGEAHPLHVVSAWASRQRLVLGQQAVADKSNEIVAIPVLLERLALTGALVTIDAMAARPRSPRPSSRRAATTSWLSRTIGRCWPQMCASSSRIPARPGSTPARPPTAGTAASRCAAMSSRAMSPGSSRTGATRASPAFRV